MDIEEMKVVEKTKKKSYKVWSREQVAKLLEFIMLNAKDFIEGFETRGKLIPGLVNHIQTDKTEEACRCKIYDLLKSWRTFGELVKTLKKSAKVDDKWFDQRKGTALSMGIDIEQLERVEIRICRTKEANVWSSQENLRLFEFILLHPEKVYHANPRDQTIRLLHMLINSKKTEEQCYEKLMELANKYPEYESMVGFFRSETKVSEEWIEKKMQIKKFIMVKNFRQEINNLKEDSLILEKAQKLFIAKDALYNCQIQQRPRNFKNSILLNVEKSQSPIGNSAQHSPDSLSHQNQLILPLKKYNSLGKKNEETQSVQAHILKFRECLFLAKYKRQLEYRKLGYTTISPFVKMMQFTEAKYQQYWREWLVRLEQKQQNAVQIFIDKSLQNIFLTKDRFDYEISRIKDFYQKDLMTEVDSLTQKSKIKMIHGQKTIAGIIQKIQQNFFNCLQSETLNFKPHHTQNRITSLNYLDSLVSASPIFKKVLPIKLQIKYSINLKQNQNQVQPNSLIKLSKNKLNKSIPTISKKLVQDKTKLKKDRLKLKKTYKNKQIQHFQHFDPQLFDDYTPISQNSNYSNACNQNTEGQLLTKKINHQIQKISQQSHQNLSTLNHFVDNCIKAQKQIITLSQSRDMKTEIAYSVYPQKFDLGAWSWTVSERLKATNFFLVNQQFFKGKASLTQKNLVSKFCNYIGTQKCIPQCNEYQKRIKGHYEGNFQKMIEEQSKKYLIPKRLLDECKILGEKYKDHRKINICQNNLSLISYPIILMNPSLKSLGVQVQKLLKQGPFFEAAIELETETETQGYDNSQLLGEEKTEDFIEYEVTLMIPSQLWKQEMQKKKFYSSSELHILLIQKELI